MITSRQRSFLSEVVEGKPIPLGTLAYFRARLRNRLHSFVLEEFLRQCQEKNLTQAELARRIGRRPEQINRWLGAAGNWTIDTVSDLLLGMGAEPGEFSAYVFADRLAPKPCEAGEPNKSLVSVKEEPAALGRTQGRLQPTLRKTRKQVAR